MFLVDTCGWIEWMTDSPLAKSYSRYLTAPDKLIVPTLIQHELYKWLYREIDYPTAMLSTLEPDGQKLVEKARHIPTMAGLDLASRVSTRHSYQWTETVQPCSPSDTIGPQAEPRY